MSIYSSWPNIAFEATYAKSRAGASTLRYAS